jgi:hypothetical protein
MTTTTRNRRARAREKLADVELAGDTGRPVGAFSIELLDPRTGKVLDRHRRSNYITPVYERSVRWWQAAMFHTGIPWVSDSTVSPSTGGFPSADPVAQSLDRPPVLPIEAMVGLDSSIAANTASSWATGRTVGYGFRWKAVGVAASGKRGQINEAQCLVTADTVRLVWDFNENQGNGTYRSLAIARPDQNGDLLLPPGYPVKRFAQANMPNTPATYFAHVAGMDATNVYAVYATASNSIRVATLPIADFDVATAFIDGGALDFDGTATEVVLAGQTYVTNTTSNNTAIYWGTNYGIAKEGTNYLAVYADGQARLYIARFNSSGTRTHVLTLANVAGGVQTLRLGVCVVGGFAYVTSTSATDTQSSKIYKVDLTSFTLSATLPIEGNGSGILVAGAGVVAIGTDLYVQTTEGIHRYQTSDGAFVENYGRLWSAGFSEQGQTPWATGTSPNQYGMYPIAGRDALWLYRGHPTASTNGSMFSGFYSTDDGQSTVPFLLSDGTRLWEANGNFGDNSNPVLVTGNRTIAPIFGGNAFSRSVLDADVTKSTSSTMKWTYELTLPASWRADPTHEEPPSP